MTDISIEAAVRFELRDELVHLLEQRGMGTDQLAEALGISEVGARHLVHRRDWPLGTIIDVAQAMGRRITWSVEDQVA